MKTLLGRIPNWLRMILIFVAFSAGATYLSHFTNPAAHAHANDCLEREVDTGPYTNGCEKPINARYCFRSASLDKTCGVVALAPGVTMSELREEYDAASNKHPVVRTTIHACKIPFIPQDVPSTQNSSRMVDGCRKPRNEAA